MIQFYKEEEPTLFHIVSGTSIGAINAAILVSYVKENKTWEGSGQRLIDFWKYLSTHRHLIYELHLDKTMRKHCWTKGPVNI